MPLVFVDTTPGRATILLLSIADNDLLAYDMFVLLRDLF